MFGHVVAHRVHRVVRLVAVERPVAGRVGDELDVARRADRHVDGRLAASARRAGSAPPSVPVTSKR